MKKILISLFCIFFISLSGISQQIKTNLNQKDSVNLIDSNNIKQGRWIESDRNYIYSGNYNNGLKEGIWLSHQKKDEFFRELQTYKKGKKNGIHIVIDRRGYFIKEENYKNNLLNGISKQYTRGSIPKSIISYRKGEINGLKQVFYKDKANKIMEETQYKSGLKDGTSKWYDEDGKKIAEYNYKKNLFDGEQTTYHINGGIMTKEIYIKNIPIGKYFEYFDNGKIKMEGSYSNGLKNGKWKEYNISGKVIEITRYKKGVVK